MSNYKTVYVDVDNTLVMSNLSDYPENEQITVEYINGPVKLVVNQKNLNLVKYFYKLGYEINVWSRTGSDWARTVSAAVGLSGIVNYYLTKPLFFIDDEPVEKWLPESARRWRNPN